MEDSILKTIKNVLGLPDGYDPFDLQVITHINTVFMTLLDLGVGPSSGFSIEDETAVWDDFVSGDKRVNAVKTYMALKARMYFDPPQNSFAISAMEKEIEQLEWRINVRQEATDYVDPGTSPPQVSGLMNAIQIQGGIDWWVSFTYKDDEGTPIPVTGVIMEIRTGDERRSRVLFSTVGSNPTLLVDYSQPPEVTITLPASATANIAQTDGWFDAYAYDPEGHRVQLSEVRSVSIEPNVTQL